MRTKNPEYYSRIISYIDKYKEKTGMIPTNIEISTGVGLSTATVSRYLSKLKENGLIQMSGHRNIRTEKMMRVDDSILSIPLVGNVACGMPIFAEESIEEYIKMPKSFLGEGDFFCLRARGESMIEIGIEDKDLVLVKIQETALSGQVVVALIENEATLKRFYPERNCIRLHPENSSMEDIYVKDCIIQGVAVKVIKDII